MGEDAQRVEEVVRADLMSLCLFVFFDLYDNIKYNFLIKKYTLCARNGHRNGAIPPLIGPHGAARRGA